MRSFSTRQAEYEMPRRAALKLGAVGVLCAGFGNLLKVDAAAPDGLRERLDQAVAAGEVPGLVALIGRGGEAWTHVAGVRDLESGAQMRRDTVVAVASIGKPVTAISALMLVEDGVLGLDAPVDPWLPELADRRVLRRLDGPLDETMPAERAITLRDLLTMRMGLGAVFADPAAVPFAGRMQELGVAPGPKLFAEDGDTYIARLSALPLAHQPGERWLYHTGLDVAGVLVARASGMPLGAFQQERIFAPLGMTDTGFHGPAERLATTYWRNPGRVNSRSGTPPRARASPNRRLSRPVGAGMSRPWTTSTPSGGSCSTAAWRAGSGFSRLSL